MSAIAQILHERGETITGSDRQESEITQRLRSVGISVSIGHSAENVNGADVVVYSAAIPADNPEMVRARERGIPLLERPVMLGRVMEPYMHRVAVTGTHGKTTTTSMIGTILDRAQIDATILVGGDVGALGGNARSGSSSIVVTEACEAFGSFLNLYPSLAVITNIDADHLDHYGTIESVEDGFRQFTGNVDKDGCIIACWDDERVRAVLSGSSRKVITFGLSGSPDYLAANVDTSKPEACYTLVKRGEELGEVCVGVPGEHNIVDSLAAAATAFELGVDFEHIREGLRDFKGAVRRFDILYNERDVMVVDDYAHHPAEIEATLKAARSAYNKRIIAVFQPHTYSRTQAHLQGFAEALSLADEVIITPIYAAREKPIEGVSAERIVDEMRRRGFKNARYEADKDFLPEKLASTVKSGDMALILGAGDIRRVAEDLAEMI